MIIWEYARFARQYDDSMYFIADLRRQGYSVYSVTDAIPDTLEGRLLESIIAWKNAKYREDLSRSIKSGFHYIISAHQGYPNRTPPLGYRKEAVQIGSRRDGSPHVTSRLIPDPDAADQVRAAFAARAEGATYAEIHNRFHLMANHVSLSGFFTNPIYIGTLRFGGREYPNYCPPLVSVELWNAVQEVNTARTERYGYQNPRRARSRFLLTGMIHCDRCGAPMNGRVTKMAGRPDFLYYICRQALNGAAAACRAPMLPKEEIEEKVFAAVEKTALMPEVVRPLLEMAGTDRDRRLQDHKREQTRSQKELAAVNADLGRIVAAMRAAGHSDALIKELRTLEADQARLTARLAKASADVPLPIEVPPDELVHALGLIRAKLRGDPTDATTVLRGLVVEIRAHREGGSPIKHRLGEVKGEITVRLPLVEDQTYVVSL